LQYLVQGKVIQYVLKDIDLLKGKESPLFLHMIIRYFFVFSIFIVFLSEGNASDDRFRIYEDSLKRLALSIVEPENDFERLTINHEFLSLLKEVLEMYGSFQFPFDSLATVSRLRAPDGSFRIFTWYVPLQNNRFEYFGFFQSHDTRRNESQLFTLHDRGAEQDDFMNKSLDHDNWYGAYYLELIHKRHRRNDYYILLGWRSDNPLTRKRIIEPIQQLGGGRPSFGQPVFRYQDNRLRRVIFEYSARVSMSMRYESHPIETGRRMTDMIIFDRMAPTHDYLEGRYQFYVPETNIFDSFVFDEGKWIFTPDIDARNPR
jgi:hypothetical protein